MKLGAAGTAAWLTTASGANGKTFYCEGHTIDPVSTETYATCAFEGSSMQLGSGASALTVTAEGNYNGAFMKISAAGVPVYMQPVQIGPNPADPGDTRYVYFTRGLVVNTATSSIWACAYYSAGPMTFAGETFEPWNEYGGNILITQFAAADGAELYAASFVGDDPNAQACVRCHYV